MKNEAQKQPRARAVKTPEEATAAPKLVKAAPEGLNDLLEDGAEPVGEVAPAEEIPEGPKTRKQALKEAEEEKKSASKKKEEIKVVPMDSYIRDKKGNIKLDSDGDKEQYAPGPQKGVGYVNENGVLFPVHYKFKGGHVGTFGNVILNKCPQCGNSNGVDQARVGICGNIKCNYSQVDALEDVDFE